MDKGAPLMSPYAEDPAGFYYCHSAACGATRCRGVLRLQGMDPSETIQARGDKCARTTLPIQAFPLSM